MLKFTSKFLILISLVVVIKCTTNDDDDVGVVGCVDVAGTPHTDLAIEAVVSETKRQRPMAKTIIGSDDRRVYNNAAAPFTAVGRIVFGKYRNRQCTGLIVGPRHVLTNSHCVDPLYPIYYIPSYNNGLYYNKQPKVTVAFKVYNGTCSLDTSVNRTTLPYGFSVANDWAIMILNDTVGRKFGQFKVAAFNDSWYGQRIFSMAGYPNDGPSNSYGRLPMIQYNCSVREYSPIYRYGYHDCDSNGGASGSGIFLKINDQPTIVALNNAELGTNCVSYEKGKCTNICVSTSKFLPTLKKALEDYP